MTRIVTRRRRRPVAASLRTLARRDEGAAAVEFAIVAPILIMVLFAIVDFGRALWTYNVAISALREGGRAGSVAGLSLTTCSGNTAIIDNAKARVVSYLAVIPNAGITANQVTVSCTNGIIQVGYTNNAFPFTPVAPLLSQITGTTITVRPAVFRWEKES
jgi:Flp pilus assembly protein TadG